MIHYNYDKIKIWIRVLFVLGVYITGVLSNGLWYDIYDKTKEEITLFAVEHLQIDSTKHNDDNAVNPLEYQGRLSIPGGYSMLDPVMQRLVVLFEQENIPVRITSGYRRPGQAGHAGRGSYHCSGMAIDICPLKNNPDFAYLRYRIKVNKRIRDYMIKNQLGIYEEIDEDTMSFTGATGKHFHISPGSDAMKFWQEELAMLK